MPRFTEKEKMQILARLDDIRIAVECSKEYKNREPFDEIDVVEWAINKIVEFLISL